VSHVDLYVVRHGETAWNREGRIQGHRDSPLTARGEAQARAVARRLARERLSALHSSDLGRARATADAVAAATGLEVRPDAGLRERAFGLFEGKTWDEIGRDHPDAARAAAADPAFVVPGGESLLAFRARVVETMERLARGAAGGALAVVTHGGFLSVLYREVMGLALTAPRTHTMLNAGVNHFRWAAGVWTIVRWGDADHLDDGALDDR
jgi:2,3-bisphosphoglycerate-dependent phosphoglycerate mutase